MRGGMREYKEQVDESGYLAATMPGSMVVN